MVSEDSQNTGWFASVHRLRDSGDLFDPRHRPMRSQLHQFDDVSELVEVISLRGSQLICLEEWNNRVAKFREPRDAIAAEVHSVVVMSTIDRDMTAPEDLCQLFQNLTTPV